MRTEKRRAARAKKKRRSRFLKNALCFIEREIPVFPVAENGKIPLTKSGFKDATTDAKAVFQTPTLNADSDMEDLLLLDPIHDVDEKGWPQAKPTSPEGD